jgi:hypothetical protein
MWSISGIAKTWCQFAHFGQQLETINSRAENIHVSRYGWRSINGLNEVHFLSTSSLLHWQGVTGPNWGNKTTLRSMSDDQNYRRDAFLILQETCQRDLIHKVVRFWVPLEIREPFDISTQDASDILWKEYIECILWQPEYETHPGNTIAWLLKSASAIYVDDIVRICIRMLHPKSVWVLPRQCRISVVSCLLVLFFFFRGRTCVTSRTWGAFTVGCALWIKESAIRYWVHWSVRADRCLVYNQWSNFLIHWRILLPSTIYGSSCTVFPFVKTIVNLDILW